MCFLGFSQSIKLNKDLKFISTESYEVEGSYFKIVSADNRTTGNYEYLIYALKDSISIYIGKYKAYAPQNFEVCYKSKNNIKFVTSSKKIISSDPEDRYRTTVYSSTSRDYNLLSFNLKDKVLHHQRLDIGKHNAVFSSTSYACFISIYKAVIKVFTLSGDKVEESEIILPNELLEKYKKVKFSDLTVISNNTHSENIGAPANRIFYDEDNVYLTYLSSKLRSSLILNFKKENNRFIWSGYNELSFGFDKKVKDYNSLFN